MAHAAAANRRGLRPLLVRGWAVLAAFAGIVAADAGVYAFIKRRGVSVTGDEPHYLVAAKALTQFSVHPLHAYEVDLRTHQLFDWPAGTKPTNLILQLYAGPHGPVTTHSWGLPALLAPFVAVGGAGLARLGLMAIETAGLIYLFVRASNLAGLSRQARVVFAILMASPAIWVAGTQIYPDLLTGILLACTLVDLVAMESRRHLDAFGTGVSGLSLAVLPWLHQQNLVPAALVLIGFALLARRSHQWRAFLVIAGVAALSWLVLLAFNLYDYGHLLGLPQPFPSLNGAGVTEILGLLFDRHQGLFVQVPTAALGVLGLWLGRRIAPMAVIATLVSAGSLIYLNGTFIHAPYGGTSFAGRFEWSSLLPLLAWCPFLINSFDRAKARLWGLGVVAALVWVLQSVPIVRGQHSYYNQLTAGPPWDPSTYPGWWGGFDRILPVFVPGSNLFGWPGFGLPIELLLLGLIVAVAWGVARLSREGMVRLGVVSVVAMVATGLLVAVAPLPLPSRPRVFSDRDLGGPIQSGVSQAATPAVPLQDVGAGTYRITVAYTLAGNPGAGTIRSYCTRGVATESTQPRLTATSMVQAGTHAAVLTLRCPTGTLWFEMTVQPATSLAVSRLLLAKTASA
jgi:hypothetical protein